MGALLEENELYTFEVAIEFKETEMLQVQKDLFDKAFNVNVSGGGEAQAERKEKDFQMVLLSHKFIVGEIEEEADLLLTFLAIIMSIAAALAGGYFCIYGVLKPQYQKLKTKMTKTE